MMVDLNFLNTFLGMIHSHYQTSGFVASVPLTPISARGTGIVEVETATAIPGMPSEGDGWHFTSVVLRSTSEPFVDGMRFLVEYVRVLPQVGGKFRYAVHINDSSWGLIQWPGQSATGLAFTSLTLEPGPLFTAKFDLNETEEKNATSQDPDACHLVGFVLSGSATMRGNHSHTPAGTYAPTRLQRTAQFALRAKMPAFEAAGVGGGLPEANSNSILTFLRSQQNPHLVCAQLLGWIGNYNNLQIIADGAQLFGAWQVVEDSFSYEFIDFTRVDALDSQKHHGVVIEFSASTT